ncbi:MAG: hypothetical protein IH901_05600, partial [Proteobacteria bacterium]|nr:hypothetical protein [Pseudomonadota bacterium]
MEVRDFILSSIGMYEAMYPNAPEESRPVILNQAIAHVIFSLQKNKGTFLGFGVRKIKDRLSVEAVPLSYLREEKLPDYLEEYLSLRNTTHPFPNYLKKAIVIAAKKVP